MHHHRTPHFHPLALALLAAAAPALAQEASPAVSDAEQADQPATLETLIVTGTRVSNRTVAESQSPIDVISPETLQATGSTELATALARALPSLNFPRPALADGTSGIRPAQLRGLSPDQVLVLVNGKRRHLSALLNVNSTIGRGSAAVDLNTIPISAIQRVEVLRDGASAQYGSDAIAGVVNVVLKGSGKGGSLAVDAGQYSAGDGRQYRFSGDGGVQFAEGRGRLHVAGQLGHQDHTNRAGPYQGSAPNTGNFPDVGEKAYVYGDPEVYDYSVSANGAFDLSDATSLYATTIASNRDITSFAFYRSAGANPLVPLFYPDGFVPEIHQLAKDRSLTFGVKGSTEAGFTWDVSYNYGQNYLDFHTRNSLNYTLGTDSPRDFYDGALEYTHNILNADFTKSLDWGLAYRPRCPSAPNIAKRNGTSRQAVPIPTGHRASAASPPSTPCTPTATITPSTPAWRRTSPTASPPASPPAMRTTPTSAARPRANCRPATPSATGSRCAAPSPAVSARRRWRSSTTKW